MQNQHLTAALAALYPATSPMETRYIVAMVEDAPQLVMWDAAALGPDPRTDATAGAALAAEMARLAAAEPSVADRIKAAKRLAKQAVADRADAIAGVITGIVPLSERLSWGTKVEAALAALSQSATAGQLKFLGAEAALLKNADGSQMTAVQLAEIIVTKSDRYMTASGLIAGLRQKTMAAIDALTNPATLAADLAAINTAAETQANALLAQLNATP